MDLEQFLFRPGSFSVNSQYCNQDLLEQARGVACLGLKLFPVSLAAMVNGFPDKFISAATSDISFLAELSVAAQPLCGHRLALGPSGLCVLILEGAIGRASFAALVPDLEECLSPNAMRCSLLSRRSVATGDHALRIKSAVHRRCVMKPERMPDETRELPSAGSARGSYSDGPS